MTARLSAADLPPHIQAQVRDKLGARAPGKPSKYHAKRTSYTSTQGFTRLYDSKAEAAFAAELDLRIAAKEILFWLPQIPFPLPGGVTYRADFMTASRTGQLYFYDVKGWDVPVSRNKRKQCAALFGVEIEVVKR